MPVSNSVIARIDVIAKCTKLSISNYVIYPLLPLQPIKYALDHEGWAVGVASPWGHLPKVLTLKAAIYLLSVTQTLLQIIADERNSFVGLAPERARLENRCRLNTYIAIGASQ